MRKIIFPALAAILGIGMSSGPLTAKAEEPGQMEMQERAGEAAGQAQYEGEEVRSAMRLLGRNLQGKDGQRLGKVSDIMIDMGRGQIAYLVVTSGGVLGVGEERRIVPWKAVYSDPQTAILTADVDAERFKEAPAETEIVNRQQEADIHRFYGVAPYWQEERQEMAPAAQPQEPQPQEAPPQSDQQDELVPDPTPLWWE